MKKDVIVTSLSTCFLKTKRFRDSIAPILRDAGAVSRGRKKTRRATKIFKDGKFLKTFVAFSLTLTDCPLVSEDVLPRVTCYKLYIYMYVYCMQYPPIYRDGAKLHLKTIRNTIQDNFLLKNIVLPSIRMGIWPLVSFKLSLYSIWFNYPSNFPWVFSIISSTYITIT